MNQNENGNNQMLGRERGILGQYSIAMFDFIGELFGHLGNPWWFIFFNVISSRK